MPRAKDPKEANRERNRTYRERNREKIRVRHAEWVAANKDANAIHQAAWAGRNADKVAAKQKEYRSRNPGRSRRWHLAANYGITPEQWDEMFRAQGSRCAVCETTQPDRRGWSTDHDHETGAVRGILCHRCNIIIGSLGDTKERVDAYYAQISRYLSPKGGR